ncbi:hypothetical protein Egran_04240 [Elaphomyces granulatus]|uniref:MYB family conidiophore development protein FlbD n=1 Tax=Elaphomyces granulatus TaxID=519963 RepID=A0A232LV59_9EURO|nr:hypothetical protein Egran_04240 [Elaphomyces granulatus]
MAPTHRRGPWVPEEDQALLHLVREQGPNNWVRISQHMHFRSPKQCRERFHQNLKPSLNHAPISAEEGMMIERMVNEMGKRWAEIARRLGNRSDNAVKNWWNGSMNRKKRGLVVQTSHPSRTYNGRVEAPYPRASMVNEQSRFQSAAIEARRASWIASQPLNDGSPVSISQLVHEDRSSPRPVPRNFSSSANYEIDSLSEQRRHSLQVDSIDSYRRLAPIFTRSPNHIEPAMTSPSFSEVSYAPSLEPSMVSDHNSISSASPRTASSPQLLPLPVDSRQSYSERRGSTPASQFRCTASYDEVYSPENGKSTDTLSEMAFMRPSLLDFTASPLNQNSRESGPYYLSPDAWGNPEPATSAQQSSRDSRMGLESLLNHY